MFWVLTLLSWYQDSRSVGAIAGLALAIVFTWRMFRSPGAPQRRQPKRQAPSTSNSVGSTQANATSTPFGASSSSEDLRTQIADALFQPVKVSMCLTFRHLSILCIFTLSIINLLPLLIFSFHFQPTLGQVVRQKLSEGRKVTFLSSLIC